ncbi:50S ribosomal protein L35 [Patescibacteria group bacterium]|nr:50S ribosomal protein L35 [Patescibacteria group bacterium]
MAGKLKTHKGTAKRIRVTKTNKYVHDKAEKRHLLTNKKRATKQGKTGRTLSSTQKSRIKTLLPHSVR